MKTPFSMASLGTLATGLLMMATSPASVQAAGFYESLDNHDNFIVAHGWGPDRWGCSFTRTQVHESSRGTKITIGKDSELKPFSCGELIYRRPNLGYGRYSIDMIASNTLGQVTSFFLIANEVSEIDIELTGLNNRVGWMNVWHDRKQNPVSIDFPFDASKDWHNYAFEWHPKYIAWFVDGQVVLNRSDIVTAGPEDANYKLAINSWTQVQPELKIDWAGKFTYPKDGSIPHARFRNMRYSARLVGPDGEESFDDTLETLPAVGDTNKDRDNSQQDQNGGSGSAKNSDGGGLEDEKKRKHSGAEETKVILGQSFSTMAAVAIAFTFLF